MNWSKFLSILMAVGIVVLLYTLTSSPNSNTSENHPRNTNSLSESKQNSKLFLKWHNCISTNLLVIDDALIFWKKFKDIATKCDVEANIKELPIVTLKNRDENKFALLPVKGAPKTDNVLVTLGIGTDIDAEKAFKNQMTSAGENMTFYGADPITETNADLYSTIGTYFPFAVGGHAGFSVASVLQKGKYLNKNVVYVDIIYFLDQMLKIKTFDHIWFDAEGAEYELFDIFYKNGRFDTNGITFCQMSIEVHNPTPQQKEMFKVFIIQLLKEERFAFFNNFNVGHMRMWLMNFESSYCRQKFLPAAGV